MSGTPDERGRIREAMKRIFDGTPHSSTGALTIVALAQEADVPRNALTQRHPDLRNEFYRRVKERGNTRRRDPATGTDRQAEEDHREQGQGADPATHRRPRAGPRDQPDHRRKRRTAGGAEHAAGQRRPLVPAYRFQCRGRYAQTYRAMIGVREYIVVSVGVTRRRSPMTRDYETWRNAIRAAAGPDARAHDHASHRSSRVRCEAVEKSNWRSCSGSGREARCFRSTAGSR
jgi:hypothetical protein